MEKPKLRLHYLHFSGKLIVVLGFAKDYKTEEEIIIYSSFYDGQVYTIPLKDFYTPHPKTGIPRYKLVTQSNNIIVKQ